jgi:glycine amidinotransferase
VNGIPTPIKKWDLIDVTLEEAHATGPCLVMIDPRTILVPAETPRIAEELSKRGLEVVSVDFNAVSRFNGGIRCATFVMRRDP